MKKQKIISIILVIFVLITLISTINPVQATKEIKENGTIIIYDDGTNETTQYSPNSSGKNFTEPYNP